MLHDDEGRNEVIAGHGGFAVQLPPGHQYSIVSPDCCPALCNHPANRLLASTHSTSGPAVRCDPGGGWQLHLISFQQSGVCDANPAILGRRSMSGRPTPRFHKSESAGWPVR